MYKIVFFTWEQVGKITVKKELYYITCSKETSLENLKAQANEIMEESREPDSNCEVAFEYEIIKIDVIEQTG